MTARALDMSLTSPFGISGGSQERALNVLVEVGLADGSVGLGEAAPFPAYNGETQAQALEALQRGCPAILGKDAARWEHLGRDFDLEAGGAPGSARAALEMALLDAHCRSESTPLWRRFGGLGAEIETDMTVTTGSADEASRMASTIRSLGIRTIKVKVGGSRGPAHDLARLEAIASAAPGAPLILDGNAGFRLGEALELARGIRALGLTPALLEQWLGKDDLESMRILGEETGWPQAADESVATVSDVERLHVAGAVQVVNIKVMKRGLAEALRVVAAARDRGLGLMIGGNVESILAMTVSASLAVGQGGFSFADLDTPYFLAENPFEGGFSVVAGRIVLDRDAPGHGVRLRRVS